MQHTLRLPSSGGWAPRPPLIVPLLSDPDYATARESCYESSSAESAASKTPTYPCHVPISTLCCTYSIRQRYSQTDRRTDGYNAFSISSTCCSMHVMLIKHVGTSPVALFLSMKMHHVTSVISSSVSTRDDCLVDEHSSLPTRLDCSIYRVAQKWHNVLYTP